MTVFGRRGLCGADVKVILLAVTAFAPSAAAAAAGKTQVLTLEQCLDAALQNNKRRPASRFALAAAEAQHRQALAGYWPQINAKAGWFRMDEATNFIFPASSVQVPAQNVSVPAGTATVTIPAGSFAPGFPPSPIQMPVAFPGQSYTTSPQEFAIPEQNVKVTDPDTYAASANLTWLLFDGGMRKGYREQAQGAVQAARAEMRRTDLEITDSVVRLYYGAVLARQLHQVGKDTLARMEVTLELTEALYKNGAGKVNKTDYLDNQVMVETIRSTIASLAQNEAMAEAALAYTMGLAWNDTVRPSLEETPHRPFVGNLDELVSAAYEFNPDWASLEAGLRALGGAVMTARSDHYPKIALTGQLHRWWNNYSAGMATAQNKAGWMLGAGVEIPIFNGFLTQNKVSEALARLAELKEKKFLLREGIGLQIRNLFLSMEATAKAYQASSRAMAAAQENRELTSRAYQSELIETEKVIRAQLFEAMMTAQHLKTRYDHIAIESQLAVVVGKEIVSRLTSKP
jgi:outer membrane protein